MVFKNDIGFLKINQTYINKQYHWSQILNQAILAITQNVKFIIVFPTSKTNIRSLFSNNSAFLKNYQTYKEQYQKVSNSESQHLNAFQMKKQTNLITQYAKLSIVSIQI